MTYHISRKVAGDFEAVIGRVKEALKSEGFGVLTEIDVAATLNAKIGEDFRPYRILGASAPRIALEAIKAAPQIGVLMPCSVVVQRHADGAVEVSAIDPTASIGAVGVAALAPIAADVRARLERAVAAA